MNVNLGQCESVLTVRVQVRVLGVTVAPLGGVDAVAEHAALAHAAARGRAGPHGHALPAAGHPPRERVERGLVTCDEEERVS